MNGFLASRSIPYITGKAETRVLRHSAMCFLPEFETMTEATEINPTLLRVA